MPRDRTVLVGMTSAISAACMFGMLGPLSRFAGDAGIEGIAFTMWRALLGTIALVVFVVVRGGTASTWGALKTLDGGGRGALALVSVTGLLLNVSIFTAFGRIPIALALMLFYTYPAVVALVDVLLGRERATPMRIAALGIASVGVVLVLASGLDLASGQVPDLLGVLLALTAAACQVVFVTVSRHGYRTIPADAATAIILLVSVLGGLALAFAVGQTAGLVAPLASPDTWLFIVIAGVISAGLSSVLFITAIRSIGGTRTGILMLIEPVVGVALAGLWLNETLAPIQAVGGALVLAGAVILQLSSATEHEPITGEAAGPLV